MSWRNIKQICAFDLLITSLWYETDTIGLCLLLSHTGQHVNIRLFSTFQLRDKSNNSCGFKNENTHRPLLNHFIPFLLRWVQAFLFCSRITHYVHIYFECINHHTGRHKAAKTICPSFKNSGTTAVTSLVNCNY